MADENVTSSSPCSEVEEKKDAPQYNPSFTSQAPNESSGCSPSASNPVGMITFPPRLSYNPFAIKTTAPIQSVADSSEIKESRPLVAPPTLKLGKSELSSGHHWVFPKIQIEGLSVPTTAEKEKTSSEIASPDTSEGKASSEKLSDTSELKESSGLFASSTTAKILLRPSPLAVQTKNLVHSTPTEKDGDQTVKVHSTSCESNGKASKLEIATSATSTSTPDSSVISSSAASSPVVDSSLGLIRNSGHDNSPGNNGFVFGQNLSERALVFDSSVQETPECSPGAYNLSFEEAALNSEELEKIEAEEHQEALKKSLCESAKEYELRQVKRKFDQVTVLTGEEDESNVLQMNCKLFAFNKVKMNWQERGRGILRLNDKEYDGMLHSRVVMRSQGSLRVVLNTKVWSGMTVEHPSQKTVRLTAFEPEGVTVYLVMAQPKEAEQLFSALNCRVTSLKSQEEPGNKNEDSEKNSSFYEGLSSSSLLDISSNDSLSDSPKKRCKSDPDESADNVNEQSFDGLIDSGEAASSC